MIAYLTGKPLVHSNELIILTANVCYGVTVTNHVLSITSTQEEISLYIYTHVKEDALVLFSFSSLNDKKLFKILERF